MIRPYKPLLFCILLLCTAFLPVTEDLAAHDPQKALMGPAFSNPDDIQSMPPGWEKKPVQHLEQVDIAVTLDQQMYPALLPVIQEYAKEHNLKISVSEGNCGMSTGRITRKEVDIAGVCCPPDDTDRLPGIKYHTLGIVPLLIFVHPDNPIDNVSFEEAQQIFQGKIIRWSELKTEGKNKLANHPIQLITRLHCKLRPGHWRLLLDRESLFSPTTMEVGAIPDMVYQVAANKWAIGYETLREALYRYKEKGRVKPLKINGYSPLEPANLLSLKYPLYHAYSITTWENEGVANSEARKLSEHLLKAVERLDSEFGIIPWTRLRQAGWKFKDGELIGEPKR